MMKNKSTVKPNYSDKEPELLGGFGNLCNNNTQFHTQNRIYKAVGSVSTAVTTVCNPYILILEEK